jgi:hypothetical protein
MDRKKPRFGGVFYGYPESSEETAQLPAMRG